MAQGQRHILATLPQEILGLPAAFGQNVIDRFKAAGSDNRGVAGGVLGAFANPRPVQQAEAFQAQREADPRFFAEYETAITEGRPQDAQRAAFRKAAIASSNGEDVSWMQPLIQGAQGADRGEFNPLAPDAERQAARIGLQGGEKGGTIGDMLSNMTRREAQTNDMDLKRPGEIEYKGALTGQANAQAGLAGARTETEDATRAGEVAKLKAEYERAMAQAGVDAETAARVRALLPLEIAGERADQQKTIADAKDKRFETRADMRKLPGQIDLNAARAQGARDGRSGDTELDRIIQLGIAARGGGTGTPGANPTPAAQPTPSAQPPQQDADRMAALAQVVGQDVIAALENGQNVTRSQLLANLSTRGITGPEALAIIDELAQRYSE